MMKEEAVCKFCQGDPFEYITVDGEKYAVAISCCEKAITTYYNGLVTVEKLYEGGTLKLGGSDTD